MGARNWSAKWRNWNISVIFFSKFNRGVKAAEVARNICAVYGGNAIGENMARNWFSHFKEDLLTLVTLQVQKNFWGLTKIV